MLRSIHIENIAVIEKSDIDFTNGLNILTGETGAGKSIIIDAIYAVLGERTSKELIRTGCDKASVTALFTDLSADTITVCNAFGIDISSDDDLIVQRTLNKDGKNTCKVNGCPVTLTMLKSIAKSMIQIHGQHDNGTLLNPASHIVLLDRYAENKTAKTVYSEDFARLKEIRKQLIDTEMNAAEKQRRIELLQYQIDEITAAKIQPGEIDALQNKKNIAQNSEKLVIALNQVCGLLYGDDISSGAVNQVQNAGQIMAKLSHITQESAQISDRLISCVYDLDAAGDEIRKILSQVEFSPEELEKIEDRLSFLHDLTRKYNCSEQGLLDILEKNIAELEGIQGNEQKREELQIKLTVAEEKLIASGKTLTKTRINAAEKFSKQICDTLQYLEMPNVVFSVDIRTGKYTKAGADDVEFLISANIGEPPKSLHKIASGGELSRIMLAIKSTLSNKDNIDALIFDEIDTGISGRAAGKVGNKLLELSKVRQVICITHLAQIAALADTHLLIQKEVADGRTYTRVLPLEKEERIHEIARIMSGGTMTENLYNSAKELIENKHNS